MTKRIKPKGKHPKFIWSADPLDPSQVKPRDLPATAGIYAVITCDATGRPIKLPGKPPHSQMNGVVYIGLAKKSHTLRKRGAQLARAWRPNSKQKTPSHGSREHYNNDPKAQQLFKVEHVKIRFMPLPTDAVGEPAELTSFTKKLGVTVNEFRRMFGLERTGDKLVADSEANAIQWFKRQYGYIPMLNRIEEGADGKPPTDAELTKLLKRT